MPPGYGFFVKERPVFPTFWSRQSFSTGCLGNVEGTRRWAQSIRFPLDIQIAKCVKFALAPFYLGTPYTRLDECVNNVIRVTRRYEVVTRADYSFLQILVWDRFLVIVPKPIEILIMVMEEVALEDGSKKEKTVGMHKPPPWRWLSAKPLASKSLIRSSVRRTNYASDHTHTFLEACSIPRCSENPTRRLG